MSWNDFSPFVRHLSVRERKRVQEAYELGFKVHGGQLRKSGEPFFTHPIIVAQILSSWGADADTLIAALLHDSVEDTPLTLEELEAQFGPAVEQLIEGVTKLSAEEFAHKPTLNEATETLRKMFTLMERDVRIIIIKLADRLHNMQTIDFLKPDRKQAIAQETLDIYVRVAEQLSMQDLRVQLEELSLKTLDAPLYESLRTLRESNDLKGEAILETLEESLKKSPFSSPSIRMVTEHKTWEMLAQQQRTAGAPVTGVPSVIVAVVCKSVPDCYYMLGTLHQLWQREALSFQDYINSPLLNGYRGLHTTIILEDGTRIRCKIRTEEMHEYTKRGITMYCFDSRAGGPKEYLPWTQRIIPLVEDTRERSGEFWKGLQSDILGASIVIHGPSSQTMQLPEGSTALDGVFFLYGERGIYAKEVFVNGKQAAFYDDLPNASSVHVVFAEDPQVQLSWIHYVHTGTASAVIRRELSKMPTAEKKEIGRTLVEKSMRKRGTVGLVEIDPAAISIQLSNLGVDSLASLYDQVAEGKVDPDQVANMFAPANRRKKHQWTLFIDHQGTLTEDVFRILRSFVFTNLTVKQSGDGVTVRAHYLLEDKEEQTLEANLKTRLPQQEWKLMETGKSRRILFVVVLLVLLWGLDPVFARYLLSGSITPYDLTFLRFVTFFITATIAYGAQGYLVRQRLKPLNPLQPSLILSGLSLFVTAFFSYLALTELPATQYILFTVSGLLLLSLLRSTTQRRHETYLGITLIAMLLGVVALTWLQGTSFFGILAGIISSLGFALYSQVSRRYQEEEAFIRARYPAFMFWVSGIGMIASVPLMPLLSLGGLDAGSLGEAFAFILVFAVLPYVLYFECMRRTESRVLDKTLPFVTISTFVGEALLSGSLAPLLAAPLVLLFLFRKD
jgi:GTP diphosphokinase / guanosine-3',5'-bis(diphosphate) 3'-diphosphatase